MPSPRSHVLALAAACAMLACTDAVTPLGPTAGRPSAAAAGAPGERWLVLFRDERVPADLAAQVAALGGRVDQSLDEIGVAIVAGLDDDAAATLAADPAVRRVEPDRALAADAAEDDLDDVPAVVADALPRDASDLPSPTDATWYPRQWNIRAVHADDVWAAGYLGWDKTRVAIVDTGIDYTNPELAGLLDMESSASFSDDDAETLADYPNSLPWTDRYSHGTSHAAMIASRGITLAGYAQNLTLFAVKTGNGEGGEVQEGLPSIYWAIKQRADVMSFGGGVKVDTVEQRGLYEAFNRVFEYAWRKGVVTVVPAGDNRLNRDAFGSDTVGMPCDAPHAICVASTAPTGAAGVEGPWTNVDAQPAANNFGHDITVSAPGGTSANPNTRIWLNCTTTPDRIPPISTSPACRATSRVDGRWAQGAGSSWGSATVAALAAMLVTKYGHNHADLIRQRIIDTADDFGAPGYDVHYGWGRVNFARALDVPIRRGRN